MTDHQAPPFTIGIEEEYLLIDPETRDLAVDPPTAILDECSQRIGQHVTPEFLRSQIEVGTKVWNFIPEVTEELGQLTNGIGRPRDGVAGLVQDAFQIEQQAEDHAVLRFRGGPAPNSGTGAAVSEEAKRSCWQHGLF